VRRKGSLKHKQRVLRVEQLLQRARAAATNPAERKAKKCAPFIAKCRDG